MTKPILFLTLLCICITSCDSGPQIPSHPVMEKDMTRVLGLKGNVLLLEEDDYEHGITGYDSTQNPQSSRWIKSRSRQFNANGQLARDEMKNEKGKQVTEYLLDSFGRYTEVNSSSEGEGEGWYERFSYYDHGKVREKQRFNEDEQLMSRETHQYDEKLRAIKVTSRVYNAVNGEEEDGQKFDFEYTYDSEDDVKEMISTIGGQVTNRSEYENGRIKKFLVNYGDGKLEPLKTYIHNLDGSIKRVNIWDMSGDETSFSIQDHYYDSTGNLIEKRVMDAGSGRAGGRFSYKYDSLRNMISEFYWSGNWTSPHPEKGILLNEKIEFERVHKYEYDPKGNWTQKELFLNNELTYKTTRKITYR